MTNKTSIVMKHPDGYWCLYDSAGKRPLNCWDKRYKGKKPSDDVVQKAERTVQFWKHQGSTMDFEVMAGRLAAEKVASFYSLNDYLTVARGNFLAGLLDLTEKAVKKNWKDSKSAGSQVGNPSSVAFKIRPEGQFYDLFVQFEYTITSKEEVAVSCLTAQKGRSWERGNNGKQFRSYESASKVVDAAIKIAEELLPSR